MGVQWGLQHLLLTLGPLLKGCWRVPGFVLVLEGWNGLMREEPLGPGI